MKGAVSVRPTTRSITRPASRPSVNLAASVAIDGHFKRIRVCRGTTGTASGKRQGTVLACVRQPNYFAEPASTPMMGQNPAANPASPFDFATGFKRSQIALSESLLSDIKALLPDSSRRISLNQAMYLVAEKQGKLTAFALTDLLAIEKANLGSYGRVAPVSLNPFSPCQQQLAEAQTHEVKTSMLRGQPSVGSLQDEDIVKSAQNNGYRDDPVVTLCLERMLPAERLQANWRHLAFRSISNGWVWVPVLALTW